MIFGRGGGLDSLYHVPMNVTVHRSFYLRHKLYIKERGFFSISLVCKVFFVFFGMKVDVQKGPVRLREKLDT